MKKILIFANDDLVIYKCRKELVQKLLEDYEVHLCIKKFKWYDELEKMGCKITYIDVDRNGTNIKNDIKLFFEYRKIKEKINPDVILTYNIKPNIYANLFSNCKKQISIVNITGLGKAVENAGILQKLTVFLYKIAMKNARCIFFQNQGNMQFFEHRSIGNHERYKLLPGSGVNLDQYQVLPYPDENEGIHFLLIARIMREKGINEFLEAANIVKNQYNNVFFDIVGFCEDAYEEKLKMLEDSGIINYYGMQNDIKPFVRKASAIVLPSYHEGMANSLLEAASMGRPVLASNVSGCKEAFDEGVSGFGFEARSVDGLVNTLVKFIELPYEDKMNMGLAGRTKMEKEFDRNIVIDSYIKEIEEILN